MSSYGDQIGRVKLNDGRGHGGSSHSGNELSGCSSCGSNTFVGQPGQPGSWGCSVPSAGEDDQMVAVKYMNSGSSGSMVTGGRSWKSHSSCNIHGGDDTNSSFGGSSTLCQSHSYGDVIDAVSQASRGAPAVENDSNCVQTAQLYGIKVSCDGGTLDGSVSYLQDGQGEFGKPCKCGKLSCNGDSLQVKRNKFGRPGQRHKTFGGGHSQEDGVVRTCGGGHSFGGNQVDGVVLSCGGRYGQSGKFGGRSRQQPGHSSGDSTGHRRSKSIGGHGGHFGGSNGSKTSGQQPRSAGGHHGGYKGRSRRSGYTHAGRIICYRCGYKGHIAARCQADVVRVVDHRVTQMSQVKAVPVKSQMGSVTVVGDVDSAPKAGWRHDDVTTVARQSCDRTAVGLHQFAEPSKLSRRGDEAENKGGDKQQQLQWQQQK